MLESINFPSDIKSLTISELTLLSEEIRKFLIDKVTKTGGHLSPNLGVVELTIALHYVFDAERDDFIWDVGHQSYVHKILTGRKDRFDRLRKKDGLSGYPDPDESKYDVFHAGHSSTSISLASGLAKAKLLYGDESFTIAIIGDGAFTGGLVYEAINTITHEKLPVIIVLNDNGMSISKNVGGIARYLYKLQSSRTYLHFKWELENTLRKNFSKVGEFLVKLLYRFKESIKMLSIGRNFFEDMGLTYVGPVDGHNLKSLVTTFQEIKNVKKPLLLHVVTKKGKGFLPSEENPTEFHGISAISVNGDLSIHLNSDLPSYSQVFGKKLCELAQKDEKIFAITAAMKSGTGLTDFAEKFPDRFIDVGIAEDHGVLFACGLQKKGIKPVVAIYSTFLQRGYDELLHDVGIGKYKILFCLDRAGLVPEDGETHQGVFDIAYLRTIPGFTILLPSCKSEFEQMLEWAVNNLDGPIAIRYPKSHAIDYKLYFPLDFPIEKGRGVWVKKGKDFTLISTGVLLGEALNAVNFLGGVDIGVYNLRFAKPINEEILFSFPSDKPILIIEEGIEYGGVASFLQRELLLINPQRKVEIIAIPDEFPPIGSREELLERYFLTGKKIADRIQRMID